MTNKNSGSKRPYTKKDPQLRFWPKVNKEAPNGCWEWTGSLSTDGYGRFSLNCKGIQAHRYSYEIAYGPIPGKLECDHTCHNRKCVNPEHLQTLLQRDNVRSRGVASNSSSGYRGVTLEKKTGTWVAQVVSGGKHLNLGRFKTAHEAGICAATWRKENWGSREPLLD